MAALVELLRSFSQFQIASIQGCCIKIVRSTCSVWLESKITPVTFWYCRSQARHEECRERSIRALRCFPEWWQPRWQDGGRQDSRGPQCCQWKDWRQREEWGQCTERCNQQSERGFQCAQWRQVSHPFACSVLSHPQQDL